MTVTQDQQLNLAVELQADEWTHEEPTLELTKQTEASAVTKQRAKGTVDLKSGESEQLADILPILEEN